MSRLTELIRQAKVRDPALGAELEREYRVLSSRRAFGLNFERHRPEAVELPSRPVRRGDKVRVLPPPGATEQVDQRLWRVARVEKAAETRVGHLEPVGDDEREPTVVPCDDLVVVAEFRDPIHPGLLSTGSVRRGGDKPSHVVINGENYHVLKALTFTHLGRVDAIYIDPPYNTGARDWKYNNDYVEGDDLYRHSKWLAFMERRLLLARNLLNLSNSVLIVTIDEKEYLRLGLLLEQVFPDGRITMITSSINNAGVTRRGTFGRAAEFVYIVQLGASEVRPLPLAGDWNPVQTKNKASLYWNRAIRNGENGRRVNRPNLFYPVFARQTEAGPVIESVGNSYYGDDVEEVSVPAGLVAIWPIRESGEHGTWQVEAAALRRLIDDHAVRLGEWRGQQTTVYYLKSGERRKIADGVFPVVGFRSDGSVIVDASEYETTFVPTDVWRISSHDAGNSGSRLLQRFVPGSRFPFPKSLYAVEDVLRFFVVDKADAVVVDFFAGSGTTGHAVMRLNRQDGGRRRSILVTNNEVSADEQHQLRAHGLRPGHPEWEAHGICDQITKPRIGAAITGLTPSGEPVKGDYRFTDEFPYADGLDENAEFFTLTYESPVQIGHNRAYARIAPLLWMRAGAEGRRIDALPDTGWDVADTYGLLVDLDQSEAFAAAIDDAAGVRIAYVVTDDDRRFQSVTRRLRSGVEPVRLYESYLSNFRFTGIEP